jgi:hypothetical protein
MIYGMFGSHWKSQGTDTLLNNVLKLVFAGFAGNEILIGELIHLHAALSLFQDNFLNPPPTHKHPITILLHVRSGSDPPARVVVHFLLPLGVFSESRELNTRIQVELVEFVAIKSETPAQRAVQVDKASEVG